MDDLPKLPSPGFSPHFAHVARQKPVATLFRPRNSKLKSPLMPGTPSCTWDLHNESAGFASFPLQMFALVPRNGHGLDVVSRFHVVQEKYKMRIRGEGSWDCELCELDSVSVSPSLKASSPVLVDR